MYKAEISDPNLRLSRRLSGQGSEISDPNLGRLFRQGSEISDPKLRLSKQGSEISDLKLRLTRQGSEISDPFPGMDQKCLTPSSGSKQGSDLKLRLSRQGSTPSSGVPDKDQKFLTSSSCFPDKDQPQAQAFFTCSMYKAEISEISDSKPGLYISDLKLRLTRQGSTPSSGLPERIRHFWIRNF